MYWTGWVLSPLPVPLLIMSASAKFSSSDEIKEGFEHLGWPMHVATGLGIVELTCMVLYLIPQTAVLGAILLTGYLGGATATHVRVEDPIGHVITPVILGAVAWLGLFLRDGRIRALLPWRQ